MATVIIGVHVAYPGELIKAFEAQRGDREAAGEKAYRTCFEPSQPNHTYFIADWPDVQKASQFWFSQQGTKHMAGWSAVDKPSVMILEDVKQSNERPGT